MSDLRTAAQQALEALEKIADWHGAYGPFPENNEAWRGMAVVTARESVTALRTALAQQEECRWLQDGDEDSDKWAASCGRHRYFQLNDGTPTDNRMKHCCYCGKPLVEVPIEPEDNHD